MIKTPTTLSTLNPSAPPPTDVALLFQGLGSSKDEWIEQGGYTSGGTVTRGLSELGIPWFSADHYGHGGFTPRQPDFDPDNISDELWPKFVSESTRVYINMLHDLGVDLESPQKHHHQKVAPRIHLISYSAGIQIACEFSRQLPGFPVASICAAVPPPDKETDDEYSLHNNREFFTSRPCLIFFGTQDEHIPTQEARWFAGQIASSTTRVVEFVSGHSLPERWAHQAIEWLSANK
jgi:hypothetical protein